MCAYVINIMVVLIICYPTVVNVITLSIGGQGEQFRGLTIKKR